MKFGVIGTNFVTDFFMAGAAQVAECEVVAVCGTSLEKAKGFGEKYGIPHAFNSYQEMSESQLIEAVYIAVPNSLHHPITTYFLEKGIPTFCEKPLAANHEQVKELIDCAKKNYTYLQEGLIPLYNPNFQILRDNLNLVGRIRQVNLNFSKYSSRYDAYLSGENPTTFRNELANGATMDLGVYIVADCVGLFGKPNKILSTASLLDTGADVAGSSILSYDDFNVTLNYSKASDTVNTCEICGELGQLLIDQPSQPQRISFIERKTGKRTELGIAPKENFSYEIAEMINQIKKNEIESTKVPFDVSLAIHETLTEMRRQSGIVFPMDKF